MKNESSKQSVKGYIYMPEKLTNQPCVRKWLVTTKRVEAEQERFIVEVCDECPPEQIIPGQVTGVCGIILNYDGRRQPRQRKFNCHRIWRHFKSWAKKNYPDKSLDDIECAWVNFYLKGKEGFYYLAPVSSRFYPLSTTGLAWYSPNGWYWYSYPDELEGHASELAHVEIVGLASEVISFESYDEFLKDIGLEETD